MVDAAHANDRAGVRPCVAAGIARSGNCVRFIPAAISCHRVNFRFPLAFKLRVRLEEHLCGLFEGFSPPVVAVGVLISFKRFVFLLGVRDFPFPLFDVLIITSKQIFVNRVLVEFENIFCGC